jgi:carbonic anhydrase
MATRRGALSRLTLVLLATALAACHTGQPGPKTAVWGYGDTNGPARWPTMFPSYCAGSAQSPIELSGATRATLPPLHLDYHTVSRLTAVHSGHDVRAAVPTGGGTLRIGDDPRVWTLVEFHFHGPSEHTLNGGTHDLEIHLVHDWVDANRITRKAVVGVFLDAGAENTELTKIWLPRTPNNPITATNFDLTQLLPAGLASYRYTGSLTTPTCGEGVLWHVLAEPKTITAEQIGLFQAVFGGLDYPRGNRRLPVQPINGRPVTTDVP